MDSSYFQLHLHHDLHHDLHHASVNWKIMPTDKPQVILDEQFITDADALYEAILTQTLWDDRMHARLTASYGAPYNYSNMSYPEVPMPTLFPALNQPPGISKRLSKAPDTPINFASHCF